MQARTGSWRGRLAARVPFIAVVEVRLRVVDVLVDGVFEGCECAADLDLREGGCRRDSPRAGSAGPMPRPQPEGGGEGALTPSR